MSSLYDMYPSSVDNTRRNQMQEPRNPDNHYAPVDSATNGHLTPYASFQGNTNNNINGNNTSSPTLNSNTPAESVSTFSVNYQSSEFSEAGDDPFFGVDFDNVEGESPRFFGGSYNPSSYDQHTQHTALGIRTVQDASESRVSSDVGHHLISPDLTPLMPNSSPQVDTNASQNNFEPFPPLVTPGIAKPAPATRQARQPLAVSLNFQASDPQLTPDTSGSGQSSEDGLAPVISTMPTQSPRVTVSYWRRDGTNVDYAPEYAHHDGVQTGEDGNDHQERYHEDDSHSASASRDDLGRWIPNAVTGHGGHDPDNRSSLEGPSMNDMASQREVDEKNKEVREWVSASKGSFDPMAARPRVVTNNDPDGIPTHELSWQETENNYRDGQTYFLEKGGELTEEDIILMRSNRNWADAPVMFPIYRPEGVDDRIQPPTSQNAIEKFERMCRDNESVVSRAATWGTRRRSLPSLHDIEGVISGNFMKKLTINRGETRRPSILKELRGRLPRMPSNTFKRTRTGQEEETSPSVEGPDRKDSLAPPSRSPSWQKKQTPSLHTAFVAMGSNMASIGTTHTRGGSISTSITSPKSPSGFSLNVVSPLKRIRSKSDLPKTTNGLADMWKRSGGPPVASLPKSAGADFEDDDDDDEELYEDADMRVESTKLIDSIRPNMEGFREHILKLNPGLATDNNFLVDRIAYHQIQRYKFLLNSRVKHLKYNATHSCPSGSQCIAQGGSARILDARGDLRQPDPLSGRYDGSDDDITPLEGAINQESFPQDIPMPPTATLPAEFECQLCFSTKKFQKPSDWTKHVHEDVQPFTCTWDKCREPRMFKRKADWVRHENEGHRHLEWWTCDVEDCHHVCYRRDNFLQHLVREHKFVEPKVKTKAAIKRAGGFDPTWQKVEKCHFETPSTAKDEPCRFCGKEFPSWKKLTVHLAKHMEQISLPILRLVARAELDADTIISPVQDPPPRPFASFSIKQEQTGFTPSPASANTPVNRQQGPLGFPGPQTSPYMYQPMVQNFPGMYDYNDMSPAMASQGMPGGHMVAPVIPPGYPGLNTQGLNAQGLHPQTLNTQGLNTQNYAGMPATSYMASSSNYISVAPDTEPFPILSMNALGLQDPPPNHMPYDMMDNTLPVGTEPYPAQGSVSPFSHSPHQGQAGFYPQ